MYLARERSRRIIRYYIRHSYKADGCYKSRNLLDLGSDPSRFIIYPGGRGYYYDPDIIDALAENGITADQTDLDPIFFDFLRPDIQRIIRGFDRRYQGRCGKTQPSAEPSAGPVHQFDKRRFHFLRFGARLRQHIHRQPDKTFACLQNKSRDEIEQYFLKEEQILRLHEIPVYVTTIFNLKQLVRNPSKGQTAWDQLDQYFIERLCQLDRDRHFWAGAPGENHLHGYLKKYTIMYFDYKAAPPNRWRRSVEDFMNSHRAYVPPRKVRIKIKEAETLFGLSWKELKRMDRTALARAYRRLALKHHPDQGGDPNRFDRLTQYYKQLLKNLAHKK